VWLVGETPSIENGSAQLSLGYVNVLTSLNHTTSFAISNYLPNKKQTFATAFELLPV